MSIVTFNFFNTLLGVILIGFGVHGCAHQHEDVYGWAVFAGILMVLTYWDGNRFRGK